MTEQMREMVKAVDTWCPPVFADEAFEIRVMRAFLNASACVADLRLVLDGKQPIRPLDSYPIE